MAPGRGLDGPLINRLPRPRGDGPCAAAHSRPVQLAPPPARGWPLGGGVVGHAYLGSPARAGMAPCLPGPQRRCLRLPRPRGDGPVSAFYVTSNEEAPPPARGWPRLPIPRDQHQHAGGSPARAGMARSGPRATSSGPRLPRPRGDGPPHAAPRIARVCGSPARAGMAPTSSSLAKRFQRLPRPRGDGPPKNDVGTCGRAAPPPARGWPLGALPRFSPAGGSPARAGMAPPRGGRQEGAVRLPRPRGDGPFAAHTPASDAAAPPPARGWPLGLEYASGAVCGSPARAGMAPRSFATHRRCCWLPRPRGDGPATQDPLP